ncbi:hypothetical protein RV00_GL002393 [Enterococcus devriesei]|uniref:Peptidase S26 domain-containing protein n=1 Tax=Enterococcus devriesei TaxID=319970 RepID=A0A1L8SU63_9ENTE|nr:hypothetical protein RV00_GL002393 [Enterococcus devriesei]
MKAKEIRKTIFYYTLVIAAVIGLRYYVFSPVVALGDSMNPTLKDGERIFGLKIRKSNGSISSPFPRLMIPTSITSNE